MSIQICSKSLISSPICLIGPKLRYGIFVVMGTGGGSKIGRLNFWVNPETEVLGKLKFFLLRLVRLNCGSCFLNGLFKILFALLI